VLFGCVWCSSPPQGSSVISRKRDLSPYAPATRRAWSPAARYGTGTKLCCVDVGAAPLRRHGTVVTVVVLGTAVVSRAAVARAAVAAPVLLWSIIVVTSHPLRHGTVVTVVVLGTAVVSHAAVAVGVIVVHLVHHCVIVVHHWWCQSNHRNHDTLVLATRKAQGARRGHWGPRACGPTAHRTLREVHNRRETTESGFNHGERSYLYSWDTQTPEDESSRQMSEHRLSSVSVPGRSMCLPCTDYAISRLMNIM
jgi:hypothetical protein